MNEINFNALPGTETVRLVSAQPGDKHLLALVFKRACRIMPNGQCEFTAEQLPLYDKVIPWQEDLPLPLASPPRWDADLFGFKPATDLVVQGHAYGYSARSTIDVGLRVGPVNRIVRVHGNRRIEWAGGRPAFTSAEPFQKLPLRYDLAYGGIDTVALAREGDPLVEAFQTAQPSHADEVARNTEFHYPRNTSGCGYLIAADRESMEAVKVPNLEFPFDPVTPDRLAVGSPTGWLRAPLPAGFDWYHPAWFPRLAFMGLVPEHQLPVGRVAEAEQGWVPPDILDLSHGKFPFFDPRYQQGASPGMAIPDLPPDAEMELHGLFPNAPSMRVRLPGWLPKVTIEVKPSDLRKTSAQVTTVVVQPDLDRVILTYSSICEVSRWYANHELANMKWSIG